MTRVRAESLGLKVLADILDASMDGIIVATTGRQIVYANPALAEILGAPREELIGRDFMEFVAPHVRDIMRGYIEESLSGRPGRRWIIIRRPDGSDRDVEYTNMVIDIDGPMFVAIVRDTTETRRQEREATALAKIAANLTIDQPMETTLETLAEIVVESTHAIAAAVMLISEDGLSLNLAGTYGLPEGTLEALVNSWPAASQQSPTAEAFHSRQFRIYYNAVETNLTRPGYESMREVLESVAWDTIVIMPLVYRNKALGVLSSYYPRDPGPTPDEVNFLKAMADQAAVAVENAHLYNEAQQAAALEERQRLARELHDSVSQALYGIGLGARTARTLLERDPAKAAEPLDYVLSLAEAGLAEMRSLIFELRPETLETEGLVAALERQARSLQARHHLDVQTRFCDEPVVPLPVKEAIYRIVQEALHNIVKHARATRVDLVLRCDDNDICFEIRDNGIGFDPGASFPGHFGLQSMRERLARLGGTIQITSSPDDGTRIRGRLETGRCWA